MTAPLAPVVLPLALVGYPGWVIHRASCGCGCCARCEAVYAEDTMMIVISRDSIENLAERLSEITEGGVRPPRYADVMRPDSAARLKAITAAHPEVELPPRDPFRPWTALAALPDGRSLAVCAPSREELCDVLEAELPRVGR